MAKKRKYDQYGDVILNKEYKAVRYKLGSHDWEIITTVRAPNGVLHDYTRRLRVPGGWLYWVADGSTTFVPLPKRKV